MGNTVKRAHGGDYFSPDRASHKSNVELGDLDISPIRQKVNEFTTELDLLKKEENLPRKTSIPVMNESFDSYVKRTNRCNEVRDENIQIELWDKDKCVNNNGYQKSLIENFDGSYVSNATCDVSDSASLHSRNEDDFSWREWGGPHDAIAAFRDLLLLDQPQLKSKKKCISELPMKLREKCKRANESDRSKENLNSANHGVYCHTRNDNNINDDSQKEHDILLAQSDWNTVHQYIAKVRMNHHHEHSVVSNRRNKIDSNELYEELPRCNVGSPQAVSTPPRKRLGARSQSQYDYMDDDSSSELSEEEDKSVSTC